MEKSWAMFCSLEMRMMFARKRSSLNAQVALVPFLWVILSFRYAEISKMKFIDSLVGGNKWPYLACLYKTTGRAIALSTALALTLHKMLKFLVKVFKSLYLLNLWFNVVDTLPNVRYWSEVLCCTIMTHITDHVKVTDFEILQLISKVTIWNFKLKFLVKEFRSLYFQKLWLDLVDTLPDIRYWSKI